MEPYLLLAPAVLILAAFFAYPLLKGITLAFYHYVLFEPQNIYFAGLDNFKKIVADPNLPLILRNSVLWVALTVGLQFLLGFVLALALNKTFRGKNLYQSVVFLPWAVSGFLIGMMFKWMFNAQNGLINYWLVKAGIVAKGVPFLALPHVSIFPVIVAMVWYGVPFFGIMILAALQSIPHDIYESAEIDGAGSWTKLFKITIPYIKPTLIVTVLLRVIWVFNSADLIYIMTNGGPANSSDNLPSYILSQIFNTSDFGVASALGLLMLVLLTVYTVIFLYVTKYEDAGDI
ncbi:sugar ABC transporter permease [Gordoniibacillus kamchatkensis]|uniref:Sugar ABC transporter permease n=1 Tax=Gordoniibacillus kamchatkensis TaxID=1590651 RepID=A0ABR5AN10_9BACL|nr:sugar ABC transporter permease [Paenibacillus sp. VKM B-2647]